MPAAVCAAVIVGGFFVSAQAQPAPTSSPAPSLAMQRVQGDVDKSAAAAAKAYADYRMLGCGKNEAQKRLFSANLMLDVYVREEALLNPDVKEATNDSDQAAMAEMRLQSNSSASAGDLAAARKKAATALRKAQKAFQKRMDAIRKGLVDRGYKFGVPGDSCK